MQILGFRALCMSETWAGQDVLKILQCREAEKLITVLVGMILIILIDY